MFNIFVYDNSVNKILIDEYCKFFFLKSYNKYYYLDNNVFLIELFFKKGVIILKKVSFNFFNYIYKKYKDKNSNFIIFIFKKNLNLFKIDHLDKNINMIFFNRQNVLKLLFSQKKINGIKLKMFKNIKDVDIIKFYIFFINLSFTHFKTLNFFYTFNNKDIFYLFYSFCNNFECLDIKKILININNVKMFFFVLRSFLINYILILIQNKNIYTKKSIVNLFVKYKNKNIKINSNEFIDLLFLKICYITNVSSKINCNNYIYLFLKLFL